MPLRRRPPPRAARARGAGVERRRGVLREREREVEAVRRRRREEEVERGGAREHLERGGGGEGATASAGGVRGRGRDTRGWRRALEPYHFSPPSFLPSAAWGFKSRDSGVLDATIRN